MPSSFLALETIPENCFGVVVIIKKQRYKPQEK